ncbi:hypothetical protein ACVB8X_01820 [Streptomyces sp. NRAIS4]
METGIPARLWEADTPGGPEVAFVRDGDVPRHLDTLPDGSETLVIGDVEGAAASGHRQGQNGYGFLGTCGLCACEGVLRWFGIEVTEHDVVDHAVRNGLCHVSDVAAECGGTTMEQQARILSDLGVPAAVMEYRSLEELAAMLEEGRAAIIAANAGVLWNDADYWDYGQANHAVQVTGVARAPATGGIQGFYINDSGTGQEARFVSAADLASGWLEAGGLAVVTDLVGTGRGDTIGAATDVAQTAEQHQRATRTTP